MKSSIINFQYWQYKNKVNIILKSCHIYQGNISNLNVDWKKNIVSSQIQIRIYKFIWH
jgi:hypothetical protein